MTDIGSSNPMGHGRPAAAIPHVAIPRVSWGSRFDSLVDDFIDFMTRILCRASRGYLCPPDMTQVMYPDESRPPKYRTKECCDEKLPGK